MAKVLLIQPHNNLKFKKERLNVPPLSLICIGTAIEGKHEVKIFDRNIHQEDATLIDSIKKFNPDIVGLTGMTAPILLDIIYVGKLIKKINPRIITVVGGVHATAEPDSVLNEPYLDYVIRGEGEEAFLEFCDTFDKNKKQLSKLRNVNKNPLRPYLCMDKLKLPNYNLVNLDDYKHIFISMSRGCPGNCSFCYSAKQWGINGRPFVRMYNTEKSIELFRDIIHNHGRKVFSISDDNFLTFKSRCIEICNFLKDEDVKFWALARADYVNDEILKHLKIAGCHTIQMGIESGSQGILDVLNKRITVEQNIEAIRCCKRNKIINDASFMIGLPTETIEDLKKTEEFIEKYKPDIPNVKVFNPLPGPPLFDEIVRQGLIKKPTTLLEWAEWSGRFRRIKHNVSKIPDDILMKKAKKMWSSDFYKTNIKKFFYWVGKGEVWYALKSIKRGLITKGYLKIPLLGMKDIRENVE